MATKLIKLRTTKVPTVRQLLAMADRHDNWARGLRKEAAKLVDQAEKKVA